MQRDCLTSDTSMALGSAVAPNLGDLTLSSVMEEVPMEPQNQIHTSDILQQALEEASQNLVQTVERCHPAPTSNPGSVCSNLTETAGLLTSQKLIELSEQDSTSEITIAFSENANGNVISIPENMQLDSLTVPVFTAESNDAVALALDNLPITAISDPVTLNLANSSVSFPCTLDTETNGILSDAGLLGNHESEPSDKNILGVEAPEDLLDSITNPDSLSNVSVCKITSDIFSGDSGLQNASNESTDALPTSAEDALKVLALPQPKDTAAPIGSSENPIQIVQHGSTYHSTQMLNQEQLAQIAQVLQQQQVNKSMEKGRSAVLYNPSTNTRIVYRVVYPSGVHAKIGDSKKTSESGTSRSNQQVLKGRGRTRKVWSRRSYEDERKLDVPDMSREEKEERKKHRPRTRSGRISKPPSYMIKDYKRLHHLDFNEEAQNDTDGGYSDFHLSEEECPNSDDKDNGNQLPPGVTTIKPRNYKCKTCNKAYIGRGGLARHYRISTGHGTLSPEEDNTQNDGMSDENSNMSESSQTLPPLPEVQVPVEQPVTSVEEGKPQEIRVLPVKSAQMPKNKDQQLSQLAKKKAKLKELIQPFCDADLLEAVMPRLSQAITLWEFLLLKSEKGESSLPHVPDIFRHFEDLLNRLQVLAQDCLVLTSSSSTSATTNIALSGATTSPPLTPLMADENKVYVEITNERVAQVLGVSTGLFEVVQWKLLQHVPSLFSGSAGSSSGPSKRSAGRTNLLGLPSRKKIKKDATTVSGIFQNNMSQVLPEDTRSLGSFPVEESCSLESNSNLSGSAAVLDKTVSLHHASESVETVEQFAVISSQSQDSNFSNSLDGSCHASSPEELPCLPISNATSLSQNLVFSSPSITTDPVDSRTTLPKVSDFRKHDNLLTELPGDTKSDKNNCKPLNNIPNLQVQKVNIFCKESNLMSSSENQTQSTTCDKSSSCLDLQNIQQTNGFLKDGSLMAANRTGDIEREISKTLPSSVEVSSSFLSLLGDTPIVMDVPLASISTRPLTVMSSTSSLTSIPSLDALLSQTELSQFRISEESSDLRDALTQAMDNQSKELECPSSALMSSNDEMPVIQLVVPESLPGFAGQLTAVGNQFESLEGSESAARNLLPSNVVIVQNEDGSTTLQLPTHQPFSLEAIQALLGMDHGLAAEILRDDLSVTIDGTK